MFPRSPRSRVGLLAGTASVVLCLGALTTSSASASAVTPTTSTTHALARGNSNDACAMPTTINQEQCQVFLQHRATKPDSKSTSGLSPADTSPVSGGLTATDLQSAYDLASEADADGAGTTVAIVDAYRDPDIATDLAKYRAASGLPACATNGDGCVTTYSETGGSASSVAVDSTGGWEEEESLDVDMVSAICPLCKIALYETNSDSLSDMGTAENTAAKNSKFVSNSWTSFDYPGESQYDTAYFNHPGVVIDFASGDDGYGAGYPASSQLVTSVGGTDLTGSSGDWTQTVWNDAFGATASGCSSGEPKPSWQVDTSSTDCPNRTENDVSAAADGGEGAGNTTAGISIYDSYDSSTTCGGWCTVGGTSAATPIVTAVYALANSVTGGPVANTYPAQYLYMNNGAGLTQVNSGNNTVSGDGSTYTCETSRQYLCNAGDSLSDGYNGPTGWGTPNGANLNSFTDMASGDTISVINPGTYDVQVGAKFSTPAIKAYDSASGEKLSYIANIPNNEGMSFNQTTGVISGTFPPNPVTYNIQVNVMDSTGATTEIFFKLVGVASLRTDYHAVTGAVKLDLDSKCADDTNNSGSNGNKVQIWTCGNGDVAQKWTYYPDSNPGGDGVVEHNGKCLAVSGGRIANGTLVELWTCNGTGSQQWFLTGSGGELYNPQSGKCLDDPSSSKTNGKQLDISTCTGGDNQAWAVPASPVQSGISGKCIADQNGSSVNGSAIWLWSCGGQSSQNWTLGFDETLRVAGKCLSVGARGTTNGAQTPLWTCQGTVDQYWYLTGTGEIENLNSEKCLASSGTGNGARLELEDCTGAASEIWSQS